jgi:hypothetical protein
MHYQCEALFQSHKTSKKGLKLFQSHQQHAETLAKQLH